ncbi:pentatricopeptide repeat-containing protein At3g02330, mitochondrial isoform X1 [Ricinus communis]|uniref:pentatricopeptide repeat-containing protein At3g02330, mitochondrial isoform X1 n=1 Tax=Ricinus communis TaxID=3988 RepID=UPI000772A521|nr:pentatricopeptide repeat-containing protein At3g02330, mitochondrial isoform X1 [Ricinus communis]|eukprot:XP_015583452.1 pentatricopeptide repeat-containing protein At3g02330, mitochondrial isoform X1 [Ricinus communis]
MAKHTSSLRLIASRILYNKTLRIFTFCTISTLQQNQTKLPTKIRTFSHIIQECSDYNSLKPGKQAHARMIVSGFIPDVYISNCLMKMYLRCSHLNYAYKVFEKMSQRDVISYNTMISGYADAGEMNLANEFFYDTPKRDVVSWNSMLSGFLQNGECRKSIDVFLDMGRSEEVGFDQTTFAVVLKACSVLEDGGLGIQVHGLIVRMGFYKDVVTGSALLDMYAKCKRLDDSLKIFSEIPVKNWVCWSAIIAGCVQNDEHILGLELFKEMQKVGIGVSQSIYASVFRSCAGLSALKVGTQLHAHALKCDFGSDITVGTATLDMYAKCGSLADAQRIFNSLPKHSLQCYNAIIVGCVRNEKGFEALQFFQLLLKSGLGFNEISLSGAFSACASIKGDLDGRQLHSLSVKSTLRSNICVANSILDMYGKCEALSEACCMFDEMERRDAVSWNAVIAAHEQNGNEEETLNLFASMLRLRMEPDQFTYGSVLKACSSQQALNSGMEIHNRIIKSGLGLDSFVGGALIDMYCKCGMIEEAKKIHDRIEQQTMVSWNAIIAGFTLLKHSEDAHSFFYEMLKMSVKPDNFTYAIVLDACANLASVGLGKQIHGQIIKLELHSDVYITSTLVDMYSKCGNMQDSALVFEKAPNKDFVTWNAMICGYAQHGLGEEALGYFERMQLENVRPNHATFVSILRACAHMGFIDKGLHYFNAMLTEYGLEPQIEHYSCMIDIIGRSGRISEALKLIQEMPFEADAVIWRTLLSICKIHGNIEIAEKATNAILQLEPEDSSACILLSNIYADAGMWGKVSEMRKMMRYNKLKKEPGCSWIEVKDEVHAFLVGNKTHPRYEEIYKILSVLLDEMKWIGYIPDIDFLIDEESEEYEQENIRLDWDS